MIAYRVYSYPARDCVQSVLHQTTVPFWVISRAEGRRRAAA